MPSRSLEDCLKAEGGLSRLADHAAHLLRLQRLFESAVPRSLVRGARVANFKLGRLVIYAENGAVAAKLRQIVPTLSGAFANSAPEVTGIEIKVQPRQDSGPGRPASTHAPLGDHAKQGLTSLADRLPKDSPLVRALRRLVGHS
ncbi:MAG TPA: DciA family protein [Rhodocyclaceae bacterium]